MPERRHHCFASVPPGVEHLTALELTGMGIAPGATEPGGVGFEATSGQLYAANLHLRTANRVLVRLAEFPARAFYELERKARRVPWHDTVAPGAPVRFRVTSRKSKLYHLDGIAERLLDSINGPATAVDSNEPQVGEGEDDEGDDAEAQLIVVRILRDVVTISADSSGALLHRRGYRLASAKAPLRETLAAAMLLGAGYDGTRPLLDPFCGAGTIPIEAALLARRIAPGLRRGFAFEHWPSFDAGLWRALKEAAESRILPAAPAPILGSDRDAGAIAAAEANAERAGVTANVRFQRAAISAARPPAGPGVLITNPPYGVRVGQADDLRDLYAQLGKLVRERFAEWILALLSADPALERQVGLRFTSQWRSRNGGIPVRLVTAIPSRSSPP
jgi:putative N6-adenine-specific DNA methylase